jgi:transposase-like protein
VEVSRKCTICTHPQRAEIDRELAEGRSIRDIARRYSVSRPSLHRHRTHVQDAVQRAVEAKAVQVGVSVLDRIRELNREARALLEEARSKGRYAAAVQAIGAATRLLELEAKLLGELDERPSVQVALVASPEWARLRAVVLEALAPYPEARAALVERLEAEGA